MSHTVINYTGLGNLSTEGFFFFPFLNNISSKSNFCVFNLIHLPSEEQQSLKTLSVRGCPEVDDWFLARLHMFQDSLEELDISHCPRITTGGLAALRNLK